MKKLLISIFIIIIIVAYCQNKYTVVNVKYSGTVISHDITSSNSEGTVYHTIVKSNGLIKDLKGLGYFSKPVGSTVYWHEKELIKKR